MEPVQPPQDESSASLHPTISSPREELKRKVSQAEQEALQKTSQPSAPLKDISLNLPGSAQKVAQAEKSILSPPSQPSRDPKLLQEAALAQQLAQQVASKLDSITSPQQISQQPEAKVQEPIPKKESQRQAAKAGFLSRTGQALADFFIDVVIRPLKQAATFIMSPVSSLIVFSKLRNTRDDIDKMYKDFPEVGIKFSYGKNLSFTRKNSSLNTTTLDGMEFKHTDTPVGTIVYFLPNGILWRDCWDHLFQLAKNTGCNVVAYNYRSTGLSTGKLSNGEELVNDGIELVQQIQNENPNTKIILHGYSLGGAVATHVAAHFAENGPPVAGLVNERSFSSIQNIISAWFPGPLSWLAIIANFITSGRGWTLNAKDAYRKLNDIQMRPELQKQTQIFVMSHTTDHIVKQGARFTELFDPQFHPAYVKIHNMKESSPEEDGHNSPWTGEDFSVYAEFAKQTCSPPTQKEGGLS